MLGSNHVNENTTAEINFQKPRIKALHLTLATLNFRASSQTFTKIPQSFLINKLKC